MVCVSWLDSGPRLTPRTAAAMALATSGAGEDGGRLGAELFAQDAKALIGRGRLALLPIWEFFTATLE